MSGSVQRDRGAVGAVAAGHEVVAQVGARVLEQGGNAVDAVVAMIGAGCVCEPTLTSLAGGGFLVVGHADGSIAPVMLDFFTRQPGYEPRPWFAPWESSALELDGTVLRYGTGPASVAVPGIPRGLARASRQFGRLSLQVALAPSMELAQDGVRLTHTQAGEHLANAQLICSDPHGAEVWLTPDGRVHAEGERFRQPALAAAIEELAATDGESMYAGDIARRLCAWSDEQGARISRRDLRAYEVIERTPLQLCVGDVCMYANPEPSMGGRIAVHLLEEMLRARASGVSRDLAVGQTLARVMQRLDPPRTHPPRAGEPVAVDLGGLAVSDSLHDTLQEALHDRGVPAAAFARSPNTTHVSAIDGSGMLAGATTTVGYGAGVFIPGTGIQLNNMLAEYDHTILRPAGATVPSMMTPAILTSPRTLVQLGSAGSDRIPYAIAQILERMWDGGSLEAAVSAPRFAWDGAQLHAEPGFDDDALGVLDEQYDLVTWPERDAYFGTTNATARRGGRLYAAGDLRREATGIVV